MVNILENKHLHFPQGLIGFEEEREFIYKPASELAAIGDFGCLESTHSSLRFYVYFPDANVLQNENVLDALKREFSKEITFLVLVTIRQNQEGFQFTGNYCAPLLWDMESHTARQIVFEDSQFSMRQEILFLPKHHTKNGNSCVTSPG